MSNKNEATNGVIEGVLVYTKIAQPDNKFESEEKEYSIGILVTEDEADEWEEVFKKQPPKKFKVSDFKTKFKFDTPEKFEDEKYVYQITLKKDASGDERFRPRIFLETDEERVDITESRLVANGSVGKVSYRAISNKYGKFAYLNNVLIQEEDFIEYESNYSEAGDEFGGDKKPVKKEEARKSATEGRKAKKDADEDKPEEKSGDEFGKKDTSKKTEKATKEKAEKPAKTTAKKDTAKSTKKEEPKEDESGEDKAPWEDGEDEDVPY